ncbi:MAG: protein LvrD [Legionella sp.]|nr:protein LvrD [Legionella sp.]
MKSNSYVAIGLITATLLLSGCQHRNPLQTNPIKKSALFLMNSSANAEKRLHFAIQKEAYGYGYLECMEGKTSTEIHCDDLYQGIVAFAKEGHYPGFNSLTLSDLTDPQVFTTLADDYAEIAVSTTPHFVCASSA